MKPEAKEDKTPPEAKPLLKEEKTLEKSASNNTSPPQEKLKDSSSKDGHGTVQTTLYKGTLVAPASSSSEKKLKEKAPSPQVDITLSILSKIQ